MAYIALLKTRSLDAEDLVTLTIRHIEVGRLEMVTHAIIQEVARRAALETPNRGVYSDELGNKVAKFAREATLTQACKVIILGSMTHAAFTRAVFQTWRAGFSRAYPPIPLEIEELRDPAVDARAVLVALATKQAIEKEGVLTTLDKGETALGLDDAALERVCRRVSVLSYRAWRDPDTLAHELAHGSEEKEEDVY